jgi:hypothetical protein
MTGEPAGAVADHGPVFIIGAPRSGSTVLAWALGRHPRLWTAGELHLFWELYGGGRLRNRLERELGFPGVLERAGISADTWLAAMGTGIEQLLLERSDGRRWVDQTPVNTYLASEMGAMFPAARFLHILRDGRLVIRSMLSFDRANTPEVVARLRAGGYWPRWADDFDEACAAWATSVDAAMTHATAHPDRCLVVRQEDLRADPFGTFDAIWPFLGCEPDPGSAWYAHGSRINSSFTGDAPADDPARVEAAWTQAQRDAFAHIAGPTMERWSIAR